jgi:hypothetical protein
MGFAWPGFQYFAGPGVKVGKRDLVGLEEVNPF